MSTKERFVVGKFLIFQLSIARYSDHFISDTFADHTALV
jgi:hypothetical protein